LYLTIKNETPVNATDSLFLWYGSAEQKNVWQYISPLAFIGMNINNNLVISGEGNKTFYFQWRVVKNNVSKLFIDSITTATCVKTYYTIKY
jgi:hypothetical protein